MDPPRFPLDHVGWRIEHHEFRRLEPMRLSEAERWRWLGDDLFQAMHEATKRRLTVRYRPRGGRNGAFHAKEHSGGRVHRTVHSPDPEEVWRVLRSWMRDAGVRAPPKDAFGVPRVHVALPSSTAPGLDDR